jgi:uncharacterized membrane protein YbhN (UPF0104 family)
MITTIIFGILSFLAIIYCIYFEKKKVSEGEFKDSFGSASKTLHLVTFILIASTLISFLYPKF